MWFVGAPVALDGAVPHDDAIVSTRPGDRHLTLAYLGRMPSADVMRVWRALPPLSLPEHARPLRWERFGHRAVALALADDDGRLRAAADACFDVVEAQLPQLARPSALRPHVTLGRVRKGMASPAMDGWPLPPAPLGLGPPTLFRLADDRVGDRYEVVEQQPRAEGSRPG